LIPHAWIRRFDERLPGGRGTRIACRTDRLDLDGLAIRGRDSLGRVEQLDCARLAGGGERTRLRSHVSGPDNRGHDPGRRTPDVIVAANDLAVGETVDLISHSPPALAISPYTRHGAVIHSLAPRRDLRFRSD